MDAPPERVRLRRGRVPAEDARRLAGPRPVGHALRSHPEDAGDDRTDRAAEPVLARRRAGGGPCRDRRRHRLQPQPWLGLHHGGAGGNRDRAALHADLRLSRPQLHPRVHRPRGRGRLSRADPHHRQPARRQSRARPPERLHHPAQARAEAGRRDGGQGGVGVADAEYDPRHQLRQLCPERQADRLPFPRGPGRRDVRHRHVLVRRRRHPEALEGDVPPQGSRPSRRGAPRESSTGSTASSSPTMADGSSTA